MQQTYQEAFPRQDFSHLAGTVEQYFSRETPLWWVDFLEQGDKGTRGQGEISRGAGGVGGVGEKNNFCPMPNAQCPIACLWVGNAIDQVRGDRHAHIFLLYVVPEHRRRGIATALIRYVEDWARARGDYQIGLQVFQNNTAALNLYNQQGYQTQSLWMVKSLDVTGK
ncbi:MAG: GNAT family N-acetyltransferase [Iphinoe sp. HA4291-MV1]|jgi:ribosomal protein S18 acetylase RimI-like enzyme|nr:GNAT family N-acetyltransferase [Iphinoe sp. HA4291-MV1]